MLGIHELQILQMVLTACSGAIGVGVGIGLVRASVKQLKSDVAYIKSRQAKLRGEDNGGIPLFIPKDTCEKLRNQCALASSTRMEHISKDLSRHTRAIKVLENFARWRMQSAGLKIEEINQILNMD